METGLPEKFVSRPSSDEGLLSFLSRTALLVALIVVIALPVAYWSVEYEGLSTLLEFKAKVKAHALTATVTANPDVWMYEEHRLENLLSRYPAPLENELAQILGVNDALVASVGERPKAPTMNRWAPVYDSGRVVGHVAMSHSLQPMIVGTFIAILLGVLLAVAVFVALRLMTNKALQRVAKTLERAQVTLHSIGDAVITTDAAERIEYMNPTAERLTGWSLGEASGKRLSKVLQLCNATTGKRIRNRLHQALADDRVVSFGSNVDLVRRNASRLAIEDSAAPIHDRSGKIVGGVLILRDVSAARAFAQRIAWEASHDLLTGLVNRREFESLVDAAVARAHDSGRHQVVCYLDLDQFKVVNDTCGHAAGDELLKNLVALLQSRIGDSDTLARLGGDEFGLLLVDCSLDRAQSIAADLLTAVADFRFAWETRVFTLSVSIGLAIVSSDTASGGEVLSMADTACYWAKEQGRNRVSIYRPGDSDMATRRREIGWIARINEALDQDRFTLYHQTYLPLTNAAGGRKHFEVLLRMIDEEGNLIQPGTFLPAAERYILMPAIDRWVVRTVFSRYRELVAQFGGTPLTCAINLSGSSLNDEGFLGFVREQALAHALPSHSICFEITETVAVNNLRNAAAFIQECKAMGILFALDDFGTGTSSFAYLKNLKVDYLKIDGGFVQNLRRDAIDKAMTEAINRIGHIMGIKTVAEYAENDAIIEELRAMGVDFAQGYGVSTPSPLFARSAKLRLVSMAA